MFRWLRRRLRDPLGFSRCDKQIFYFREGRKWRRADPLFIKRAMIEHGGKDWHDLIERLDPMRAAVMPEGHPVQIKAIQKEMEASEILADLVRKAFKIKPFDESGVTEQGCLEILTQYLVFMNELGNSVFPFVPSRKLSGPGSSAAESTTGPTADSKSGPTTMPANGPATA